MDTVTPTVCRLRLQRQSARTRRAVEQMRYLTAVARGVLRGAAEIYSGEGLEDVAVSWGGFRSSPVRLQYVSRRLILSRPVLLHESGGVFDFPVEALADCIRHHCAHLVAGICWGVLHDAAWRATARALGAVSITPCEAICRT